MQTVDKFLAGALGLIALYILFNQQNASSVITSLGTASSKIFATLQGRG